MFNIFLKIISIHNNKFKYLPTVNLQSEISHIFKVYIITIIKFKIIMNAVIHLYFILFTYV